MGMWGVRLVYGDVGSEATLPDGHNVAVYPVDPRILV